jgi:hypothetical protein
VQHEVMRRRTGTVTVCGGPDRQCTAPRCTRILDTTSPGFITPLIQDHYHPSSSIVRSDALPYPAGVNLPSAIGRLLCILAIIGLGLGPLARSTLAAPIEATAAHHGMAHDETTSAISEEMPCCPKKTPTPHCSKECLASCASQILAGADQRGSLEALLGLASLLFAGNDADGVGLKQRPPPRPPKI